MLDHSAGSGRHPLGERGLDQYWTPPCATQALLRVEQLPDRVWEPAAGAGHIVKVLRDAGHGVIASDIRSYDFPLHFTADFFGETKMPAGCEAIVSNPPYRDGDRFVRHALELAPQVFMLLRLGFLESRRRTDILEGCGLRVVHLFRGQLPFMHRSDWAGRHASSSIAFGWFAWDRAYRGPITVNRISWEGTMSVQTSKQLRRQAKHLDALNENAANILAKMERGAVLHCEYRNGGRHPGVRWWLSAGSEVSVEAAQLVINNEHVVAVGRALFDGLHSQTYRYSD